MKTIVDYSTPSGLGQSRFSFAIQFITKTPNISTTQPMNKGSNYTTRNQDT